MYYYDTIYYVSGATFWAGAVKIYSIAFSLKTIIPYNISKAREFAIMVIGIRQGHIY